MAKSGFEPRIFDIGQQLGGVLRSYNLIGNFIVSAKKAA